MTDHLPECDLAKQCRNNVAHDDSGYGDCLHCGQICECDRLRACEARVREECGRAALVLVKMAYRQGLDAAREAVAALDPGPGLRDDVGRALAAIDAIKEGSHV